MYISSLSVVRFRSNCLRATQHGEASAEASEPGQSLLLPDQECPYERRKERRNAIESIESCFNVALQTSL